MLHAYGNMLAALTRSPMAAKDDRALVAGEEGGGGGGVSLGKGAWDCDTNSEIPPEKEVSVMGLRELHCGLWLPLALMPSCCNSCSEALLNARPAAWAHSPAPLPFSTLPAFQAIVFEEIATMDFPFEGIPTVPPRKVRHQGARCRAALPRQQLGAAAGCCCNVPRRLMMFGSPRFRTWTTWLSSAGAAATA